MVEDVVAVENDDHDLTPVELDRLMQHYRDPSGGSRQTLGELTLDLTGGYVAYTDRRPDRQIADPIDRVLAQYVQMLYVERSVESGTRIPIKDIDLTVLRLALSVRKPEVVRQIESIQSGRMIRVSDVPLPAVAAGGLALLGAVLLGMMIASPADEADVPSERPAAVQSEAPVTQAVDSQSPGAAPEALANTEESVVPVEEITVEIGEAVTLVRPPD